MTGYGRSKNLWAKPSFLRIPHLAKTLHKQLLLEFGARRPHCGFLDDHKSVQINVYQGYSFGPSKLRRVLGVCTLASSVSFDQTFYRAGKFEAFGMKHA